MNDNDPLDELFTSRVQMRAKNRRLIVENIELRAVLGELTEHYIDYDHGRHCVHCGHDADYEHGPDCPYLKALALLEDGKA